MTIVNKSYNEAIIYFKDLPANLIFTDVCYSKKPYEDIENCLKLLTGDNIVLIVANEGIHIPKQYVKSRYSVEFAYPERIMDISVKIDVIVYSKKNLTYSFTGNNYYFDDNERIISIKQKPQTFYKELIETYTQKGDIILDCSADRGMMISQALKMKRNIYAAEGNLINYRLAYNSITRILFDNKQFSYNYFPFFKKTSVSRG